jgi:hypothetical protein
MLIVACREMTSGDKGVNLVTSKVLRSCKLHCQGPLSGDLAGARQAACTCLLSEPFPFASHIGEGGVARLQPSYCAACVVR